MTDNLAEKSIIDVKRVNKHNGFFRLDEMHYRYKKHQGGVSNEITNELFIRGDAVVVLLYDAKHEKIILVEQCRTGAIDFSKTENQQAWLLEPVAGMIDEGETQLEACAREAEEEAGVKNATFEYIYSFYPSPGACEEKLHLCAADIDHTCLPKFAGLEHESEDIRVVTLSYQQAKQKLQAGEFNASSTIIAIQWLLLKGRKD